MSHGDKQGLLKFFSVIGTKSTNCEFVDFSTPRSRPQSRQPRITSDNTQSFSPSPSTKRKRRLTELDQKTDTKKLNMSSSTPPTPPTPTPTPVAQRKLSPELLALKDEMQQDMLNIIAPLQASIKDLVEGLKECQLIRLDNKELHTRLRKVETDNKYLRTKVQHLEDKLLEGNIIF